MSNISEIKAARFKEAESKRHNFELRKLKTENSREYNKQVKTNETTITRMQDGYQAKISVLKNELEQKLINVRDRQERNLVSENQRLDEEVTNLKKAHEDQVTELKHSQENEINDMVTSHKKTVENARQKYISDKMKWDA